MIDDVEGLKVWQTISDTARCIDIDVGIRARLFGVG